MKQAFARHCLVIRFFRLPETNGLFIDTIILPLIGNIPSILMFRTGGASSVRGYELDSIGLDFDKNTVLPDRTLAVASAEYQYPFMKDFAVAVFHDAGGVDDSFKRITFRHGTGLGLRWFSPAAPFSFDIAYGHHDKKVRWHISLGTRF